MSLTAPEELARLEKKHEIFKDEHRELGYRCDELYALSEIQRDEIEMLREVLDDLNIVILNEDEEEEDE